MSSAATTMPLAPTVLPPEPVWPLSVDQYHQMIAAGILTAEHPVELLDGCLVPKMPKNPLHSFVTQELRDWLKAVLPPGHYFVNDQEPTTLSTSEPEPDITVVRGNRRQYASRHPQPAEVALLIEVADSSLSRDRGHKLRIYARAGIAEYWIVNLIDRQIEQYRDPDATNRAYRQPAVYAGHQALQVVVDENHLGELRLEQLLPA